MIVCTKFGMVLLLLVLPEVVGWMINHEYLDKIVVLALSLIVLASSFVPGIFIIPVRPVNALWRLSLEQNDEEMLLLVRSNFGEKYYHTVISFITSADTVKIF